MRVIYTTSHPMKPALNLVFAAALLIAAPISHASRNPLADLLGIGNEKELAQQRSELEAATMKDPHSVEAWMALASFSYQHEQPEETLKLLQQAIERVGSPSKLWRFAAEIHIQDAQSGPQRFTRPNCSKSRSTKSELSEKDFVQMHFNEALACLNKALEHTGDSFTPYMRTKIQVLGSLGLWTEARQATRSLLEKDWNAADAAMGAYCLLRSQQAEEALQEITQALSRDPRHPDLHAVSARIHEALGHKDEASAEEKRFNFFRRLLPGSTLDYSDEVNASLERLFACKENTDGMFSGDRMEDVIKAELDSLEASNTELSSELLATFAWNHFAHGELEDRAFAILGERKDEERLRRIVANARSNCTYRGCLQQMVRLHMDGTFELLRDLLDNDGGMFPIGVVGMLEELNEPRAAGVLRVYSLNKNAQFNLAALIALGKWDTPENRRHLEQCLKDQELAPYAASGLHRITQDPKLLKIAIKRLAGKDDLDVYRIAAYLETLDNKKARAAVKAYNERLEKERKRQEHSGS